MSTKRKQRWICTFHGRPIGSIGVMRNDTIAVYAIDEESARMACYETHDHISAFKCRLVEESEEP